MEGRFDEMHEKFDELLEEAAEDEEIEEVGGAKGADTLRPGYDIQKEALRCKLKLSVLAFINSIIEQSVGTRLPRAVMSKLRADTIATTLERTADNDSIADSLKGLAGKPEMWAIELDMAQLPVYDLAPDASPQEIAQQKLWREKAAPPLTPVDLKHFRQEIAEELRELESLRTEESFQTYFLLLRLAECDSEAPVAPIGLRA